MHKFAIGFAVVSTCVASAFAGLDGTGTISQSGVSAGNGGEFTITPTAGYLGEMGLPADFSTTSFQTFCMETNEQFSPGGSYDMAINTVAIMGGSGGPNYPLQPETAFLYYNFRMGTLFGYDYGAGRQSSAAQLQQAIWFLQGNQSGGANNAFAAAAIAAVASNQWSGIGDVRVLNVYGSNGALGQDQLTIIPTPGAAALVGLGGLLASRRRR